MKIVSIASIVATCLLVASPILRAEDAARFKVVINAANPVAELSRTYVSKLFLKKVTRWDDGSPVAPVDQAASSPVRDLFSTRVHDREVGRVESYWQRMIFSGRAIPPPELVSDEAVLGYVRENPYAIGYVGAQADLPPGVKAVRITG